MDYIIHQERPEEYALVENLTREAFWNVYRPGCSEHYILHCFRERDEFIPELDLVMEQDGKIIGHIMYVRAKIQTETGEEIPVLTFGPISIAPAYQRKGYGKALVDASMEIARQRGDRIVCIEGNIDFYGHSGFVVASTRGIHLQGEPMDAVVPYFLVKELEEGALEGVNGVYITPAGYFVEEAAVERFDAQFPPKQKQKLPGQLV